MDSSRPEPPSPPLRANDWPPTGPLAADGPGTGPLGGAGAPLGPGGSNGASAPPLLSGAPGLSPGGGPFAEESPPGGAGGEGPPSGQDKQPPDGETAGPSTPSAHGTDGADGGGGDPFPSLPGLPGRDRHARGRRAPAGRRALDGRGKKGNTPPISQRAPPPPKENGGDPRHVSDSVRLASQLRGKVKTADGALESLGHLAHRLPDSSWVETLTASARAKGDLDAQMRTLVGAYETFLCSMRAQSCPPPA